MECCCQLDRPTSPFTPPLLNFQTSATHFVIWLFQRESSFKGELPLPLSLLWPPLLLSPEEVGDIAGISQHTQGPYDFSPSVVQTQSWLSPPSGTRIIPIDWRTSTSDAPLTTLTPLMDNELLVKINLSSPPHPHLRRHAEKTTSATLLLPTFQMIIEAAEVSAYLLFIAAFFSS